VANRDATRDLHDFRGSICGRKFANGALRAFHSTGDSTAIFFADDAEATGLGYGPGVDSPRSNVGKHGFQRFQVAVHIASDRFHQFTVRQGSVDRGLWRPRERSRSTERARSHHGLVSLHPQIVYVDIIRALPSVSRNLIHKLHL
jgi:hypothetical protein